MTLEEWLADGFETAFPGCGLAPRALPATDPKFGDFQCNDALAAAKTLHLPPRKIAESVYARLLETKPEFVEKLELAGPGFLNVSVSSAWIAARLAELAAAPGLGVPQTGAGKTVVIDYSSPNAAKQMHIGHIRSTVIGNAVDRIFRALGYRVVADNHLGDWGTQFGILIKGYRECLSPDERDHLTVANLEKCYVLSAAKAKEEDGLWKEDCRRELVKLQKGDPENRALWKRFIDISIAEFDRMYAKLGVQFDTYRGESYYNDRMPGVVARLAEMGLAVESEGALVVNLEAEKLGVAIVRKSDGGFNYTTSDLACVESRVTDYAPERIVYVTDARQQLHFRQWFSIAAKMGVTARLVHVPFGLMSYGGKAISTREGNLVKLDDLLAEAVRRAKAIVLSRTPDCPNADELAAAIGYGAVKYSDLSHDPITDVDFDWDKALALEGNSGPYLQYAHARVCSLLEKAGADAAAPAADAAAFSPVEKQLALQLLRFGSAVLRAAENYKPSVLADYLFQTAQLYSSFYQRSPILKSEPAVRAQRLALCALVGRVLEKGLGLLGIDAPRRI